MKIESILKRDPPTSIKLGDTTYQFKPDETGAHVCEVEDRDHVARLLSIPEGYRLPGGKEPSKALEKKIEQKLEENPPVLQPVNDQFLMGSTVHPATFEIGGVQVSIEDILVEAHEMSGLTTLEWNQLPEDARHNLIDAALDARTQEGDDEEDHDEANRLDSNGQKPEEKGLTVASTDKPASKPAAKAPAKKAESKPAAKKATADKPPADPEREAAAQEYKEKTGSLPHGKWTTEKIREELAKPPADSEQE